MALHAAVQDHLASMPEPALTKVMVCAEGYQPMRHHSQGKDFFDQTFFLERGDIHKKKGEATPSFLQVLMRPSETGERWRWQPPDGARYSGRRRSLAAWITDLDHGAGALAARVMVNRLWQHHFGTGLVSTPNDFGVQGARPSHPELLDWLAAELVRQDWRLKPMHELIMNSAVYRQSARLHPEAVQADPDNRWWARREPRRLEGETIRDAMLLVSGALDDRMFGPGTLDESSRRRSIYFTIKRSRIIPMMQTFDQPEPLVSQANRPVTTVAPQALLIMNNAQVRSWAQKFGQRLLDEAGSEPIPMVRRAYELALGREPTRFEEEMGVTFLQQQNQRYAVSKKPQAETLARTDFAQVMLGLNEFVYVE
jgi:hypothetical protein